MWGVNAWRINALLCLLFLSRCKKTVTVLLCKQVGSKPSNKGLLSQCQKQTRLGHRVRFRCFWKFPALLYVPQIWHRVRVGQGCLTCHPLLFSFVCLFFSLPRHIDVNHKLIQPYRIVIHGGKVLKCSFYRFRKSLAVLWWSRLWRIFQTCCVSKGLLKQQTSYCFKSFSWSCLKIQSSLSCPMWSWNGELWSWKVHAANTRVE